MCLLRSESQTADRDMLPSGTKAQNREQQRFSKLLLGIVHTTSAHGPLANASHVSKHQQGVVSHRGDIGRRSAVTLLPLSSLWGPRWRGNPYLRPAAHCCSGPLIASLKLKCCGNEGFAPPSPQHLCSDSWDNSRLPKKIKRVSPAELVCTTWVIML